MLRPDSALFLSQYAPLALAEPGGEKCRWCEGEGPFPCVCREEGGERG